MTADATRNSTIFFITNRSCVTLGGAGGSRTLVQTGKPYAFYMLILAFIFVLLQDPSHQQQPYPLKFHPAIEVWQDYFRFNLRRLIFGFGTTSSERRLVLSPGDGIEPQSTILRLGSESILIVANYFFDRLDYGEHSLHSACLRTISSCCQIQSTPGVKMEQQKSVHWHDSGAKIGITWENNK